MISKSYCLSSSAILSGAVVPLVRANNAEVPSATLSLTCSLRVIIQALQGVAQSRKSRIDKPLSILCLAPYCVRGGSRMVSTEAYLLHNPAHAGHAPEVRSVPRQACQHPANPGSLLSLDALYGRNTADGMYESLG